MYPLLVELGIAGSIKLLCLSAWNSNKNSATLSGRKQSLLYRPRRAPSYPREIMVQSSVSYPFIPLPPPDRECVIIRRDHAIDGTKEEMHAFKT
jgi:hypothetical protein